MKKSGRGKNFKKNEKIEKKKNRSKNIELEEEREFSSENEYMNFVGQKNEMKNDIEENFDDPFYYMMGNSDNIVSKSTYSKVEYENGKPVNEEYYQSECVNHKDKKGHKITEKKEKYKNAKDGIEKISHQKLLDGKGTKVIKKVNINNGNQEEHNIYKGIKENNIDEFNKKYDSYKKKVNLDGMLKSVKLLGNKRYNDDKQNKVLMLGDGNEKNKEKKREKKEMKKNEKQRKKNEKEDKKLKNKKKNKH